MEKHNVHINIPLPTDLHTQAKVAAAQSGLTLKDWLIKAIEKEACNVAEAG